MTLSPTDRQAIIDYRLEKGLQTLAEANYVAAGNFWSLAANRLYYSTFYICEALLIKNRIEATTHAGVSRMINLHYVRTGILSADDGYLLKTLFRMRQTGDYDDLTDWEEKDVAPIIPQAQELIKRLMDLVKQPD